MCQQAGRWKRIATVAGVDQLEAFDVASRALPPESRDPIKFQASDLCPPADDNPRAGPASASDAAN